MRRGFVIFGSLLLVGGTASATPAVSRQASVTIVHAVPGFEADVYLDGVLILDAFESTETARLLRVDPGRHEVDIREIGAAADSSPVLSTMLRVGAGSNTSIVAHLAKGGSAKLTLFDNSFARLPAGRSLLQVRNLAGGPRVSVRLDGRQVQERIYFGDESSISTVPGRHRIAFLSPSSNEVLIPAVDIHLREGVAQIVYVLGSGADGFELILQSVGGLSSPPSGVLTGIGGLGAESPFPGWVIAVMVVVGVTLVVRTTQLVRERE